MKNLISILVKRALVVVVLPSATVAQAQVARPLLSGAQHAVDKKIGKFIAAALNSRHRLYRQVVADKRGEILATERVVMFLKVRLERGVHYRFGARGDADALSAGS